MSDQTLMSKSFGPFFATEGDRPRQRALEAARQRALAVLPTKLLSFTLADEEFALPLLLVQEICVLTEITCVPRVGPAFLGIMALRGNVVPVVDLAAVLKIAERRPPTRSARGVLLTDALGPVALQVTHVRGVVRLPPQDFAARPFDLHVPHPELVQGLGRTAKGILTVLDGAELLRHLEKQR